MTLLLAPKALKHFTPEEFKQYVRSLNKPRRVAKAKVKRSRDYKVTVRLLKSGKISVKTKRPFRYVTEEEYRKYAETIPENLLFIALRENDVRIYKTHSEAERILLDLKDLPW